MVRRASHEDGNVQPPIMRLHLRSLQVRKCLNWVSPKTLVKRGLLLQPLLRSLPQLFPNPSVEKMPLATMIVSLVLVCRTIVRPRASLFSGLKTTVLAAIPCAMRVVLKTAVVKMRPHPAVLYYAAKPFPTAAFSPTHRCFIPGDFAASSIECSIALARERDPPRHGTTMTWYTMGVIMPGCLRLPLRVSNTKTLQYYRMSR